MGYAHKIEQYGYYEVCRMKLGDTVGENIYSIFSYSYTVYGDIAVSIEGHKGIRSYTDTKVLLKLKSGTLAVCGSNLILANLTQDYCLVRGKSITVEIYR